MRKRIVKYVLVCDFCNEQVVYETLDESTYPDGWQEVGQYGHYCPTCKPRQVGPTSDHLVGLDLRDVHPSSARPFLVLRGT